uniref:Reverse transcriptase domain-containing protein n=1 Tax=Tanacetum cinerariifolium TaxID=118510 RepID=A0A699I1A0_TANCI|nr:hypothetical protein [Tanacetum cinerariifolium]
MRDGFCSLCNSRNSCVYDPNPNSFDCPPNSYHPPHPTYETYSGDSCGNDSHFGTDCPPRFSPNYDPEPGYIQNYNSYPHDSPNFPQQYLCCDNCGGLHETFHHTWLSDYEFSYYGDEHLDTIPEKESDELNKSSVEDLVPNPSDADESSHEEDIHKMSFKTYSNPLFDLDEEIISSEFNPIHNEDHDSTPKNDRFDTDSYLLESSLNRDTLMISSLKIDSLLAEFAGELIFLKSIPPGIDEANCDPKEDIHLVERLLYDNSSPRPPEEFVFENYKANIESFSLSPIQG